ncbi:MAG: helix-turn-helix transcriptional regulator [Acidobacteriaceae bacterium]|nr:helix-turn-helix transcriptional regulator [Acidobacteriaceae bacterium]
MTADAERPRLRELRTDFGWTQQELADRIAHLAWMEHRERVGINADMVAKWERGAKGISPRYRELLCRLFGVTPNQLGLKNTPQITADRSRSLTDDQSLIAMLDKAAGLLDQLGAAGTVLAPHMLHAWKDAVTTRRTMLGLLDPSATDPIGHARAATATVADFEQLAERYHALYETADPAALLTSVAAHVRLAQDSLSQRPTPDVRRRLLRNLAEVAILAGQLASDDLGNTMSGRAYYSVALDAAREEADDQLTAVAHGHAAQLAAAEGQNIAALACVTSACEHAESTPSIASWLATIEATIHADRGDHAAARNALKRAQTTFNSPGGRPLASLYHHSSAHLTAAAGRILLQAGDHTRARELLTAAVGDPCPTGRRQRVLLLVDLAVADLHSGDLAAACSHATQAAELLQQAAYSAGADRLRAFREAAQRPLTGTALRILDHHIARIAA